MANNKRAVQSTGWSATLLFANPEDRFSRVEAHIMHQSFATTSPPGPGNSGDIDFFHMQSPGKIPALQGLVLVKSLLKVPAPGELLAYSWAFIMSPCNKPNTKSYG